MWALRNRGISRHASHSASQTHRRLFFFNREKPKLFGLDGLEKPKDFIRLADDAIKVASSELSGSSKKTPLQLVTSLDTASNALCRVADAAELCRSVHPDEEYIQHANEVVNSVSAYMGEVNLDASMHTHLKAAETSEGFEGMPLEARRVLHHMRVSMEHEGIHLPDAEKAECLQLLEREQELSFGIVQRQERIRRSSPEGNDLWVPADGVQHLLGHMRLPRRQAAVDEVSIPLEPALLDQVLSRSLCSETRRRIYEVQHATDDRGEEEMASLLLVRQRLAQMRGYGTWNEYAQRESLLGSPDRVNHFLESAWDRLRPGISADLQRLSAEKQRSGGDSKLDPWDLPILLREAKQREQPEARGADISEYLSFQSLMRGVDFIVSRLLGLSFAAEEPGKGEVWHPSVQKYTLRDGKRPLGVLYLDPFARPGKVVQSAQFTLQGSKVLEGGDRQMPVAALVFSLPATGAGLPAHHAVTFMHEMGHALHSLLSETSLQHLSGTRGTVDFVEFPSHLFEHFVLDPSCLALYATHSKTGAALPADLQESYRRSRSQFAHFEAVQQLMYALVDQTFFSCLQGDARSAASFGDGSALAAKGALEVQEQLVKVLDRFDQDLDGPFRGSLTTLLGLSKPSKFDHLVHYGGSYYCYLFNRALSAHVWQNGFHDDPFNPDRGASLREFFRGGSVVQNLDVIQALSPGVGGFRAEDVPLDAFVSQLSPDR